MPTQRLIYKVHFEEDVYVAKVDATYHVEGNWGADADGNNGTPRLFVDDVHVLEVMLDGSVLKVIPDDLKEKILKLVDENL